ncbi:hypothetical protein K438DRAFT_2024958 [Mycena galopus ATCC 62051]|nr:hypothetical protein K438DRAFT_2024958 [Mycena galopus ATCC 62051]
MDDAELPHSVVAAFQNVVITRYIGVAGLVVLLYDHLLTLDDEVKYIWTAPRTLAKGLFLLLRYMVPLFLIGETITRNGLVVITMSTLTYAGWLSIAISNFLVLLRIWATLPRAHRFIGWSFALFVVMQLISLGTTTWVVSLMIRVLMFDPDAGVCTFTSKPHVFALWVPGLFFEVVVFVTCCWNTLDRPRALGPDDARITRTLFRDGVTYFVILFILRIANTVIAVVAPVSAIFIIVFFIWAATTLTTGRLIINSRREAAKADRLRERQNLLACAI